MGNDASERAPVPAGLKGLPWFAGCTDAQLVELASLCEHLAIDAGEVTSGRAASAVSSSSSWTER